MRLTYTWTEQDWREAQQLARRQQRRGTPLPGMTLALLGIFAVGALVDLAEALRGRHHITLRGAVLPLILLALAVLTGGMQLAGHLRRKRREALPMPPGEREAVLQEAGWLITEAGSSGAGPPTATPQPNDNAQGHNTQTRAQARLRPWSELVTARQGAHVVVLVRRDGFDALPIRCLSPEQGGRLHRMVTRKLRPA